ncbi:hypothetical protein V9T40_003293 [Parthenolecanium corni]|uniref:Uncharacterized protein n=1 Tax=Parthenolecanium corni TaxID=536013 RepID=A0AAN9TQC5_9HEMI
MYTPYNDIPFEDLDLLGEQIATYTPEIIKVEATQIPIRTIHIPFELTNEVANSFRAFGEVVEVYFLTKHYGFFDTLRTYWKVKNLILIMDQLRRESLDDSDTVYPIRLTRVDRAAFQEYDNDDVIGRDKSYGEEIDTQTSSYTTDIPSTSINLMDD